MSAANPLSMLPPQHHQHKEKSPAAGTVGAGTGTPQQNPLAPQHPPNHNHQPHNQEVAVVHPYAGGASPAFVGIGEFEAHEFEHCSRDELLLHIGLQRNMIRSLYMRLIELERRGVNTGSSPGATPAVDIFATPPQQQHQTGGAGNGSNTGNIEHVVDRFLGTNLFGDGTGGRNSPVPAAQQHVHAMATTISSAQHQHTAAVAHPHPQQQHTHQHPHHHPHKGWETPGQQAPLGGDDALQRRLHHELMNVRRALGTAIDDRLPTETVAQLEQAEQELVQALSSLATSPAEDELEAYKAQAYARGMSTFTNPAREKASLDDVAFAVQQSQQQNMSALERNIGRRSPVAPALNNTDHHGGNLSVGPSPSQLVPVQYDSYVPSAAAGITGYHSPALNRRAAPTTTGNSTPRGRLRVAPYAAEPVQTLSLGKSSETTYRHSTVEQCEGIANGDGPASPPLPLLRKLQYRLQSHMNEDVNGAPAGGGGGGGGRGLLADDVSSIHVTTDPTTGQLIIGRSTKGRDTLTPSPRRAPGGGGGTYSPSPAAERISAYRRGRGRTPNRI